MANSSVPAHAAPGDAYTANSEFNISVGVRLVGPGFATFVSTVAFLDPAGEPTWSYCVQAPVPGGGDTGTETLVESLTDANSQNVRDNAHSIAAVLMASTLPSAREFLRVQFASPRVVFDYDGNIVPVTGPITGAVAERSLWNWFYPSGLNNLPFAADVRIEVAAVQAAIWHYSDGFEATDTGPIQFQSGVLTGFPPSASSVTRQQILDRYLELVAIGDAAPAVSPALVVEAAQVGNSVVFSVSGEDVSEPLTGVALDSPGRTLYAYDASARMCDTSVPLTTVDIDGAPERVCVALDADADNEDIALSAVTSIEIDDMIYLDRGGNQDVVVLGRRELALNASAMRTASFRSPPPPPEAVPILPPLALAVLSLALGWAGRRKLQ